MTMIGGCVWKRSGRRLRRRTGRDGRRQLVKILCSRFTQPCPSPIPHFRALDSRANFPHALAVAQKPHFHCDIRASFACAFGNWRRKHKIPLKKIAGDLGISVSTVNLWESGKRFPGGYNFEMLVDYAGLPPCKLFCVMADNCVPTDCLLATCTIASKGVR